MQQQDGAAAGLSLTFGSGLLVPKDSPSGRFGSGAGIVASLQPAQLELYQWPEYREITEK
jgi:hypothetical protein